MIGLLNTKKKVLIQSQAVKDNAEWVGSKGSTPVSLDCAGFHYANIAFCIGFTDKKVATLRLYESDDDSTYTAITGASFGASSTDGDGTLPTATDDNKIFEWNLDLRKRKRYIQVEAVAGNGTTGTYAVCIATLSRADELPNNVTERGVSQTLTV